MKRYSFSFEGRQSGALGVRYRIQEEYKAEGLGQALWMLYTDYEHIAIQSVKENDRHLLLTEVRAAELIKVDYQIKPNRK